MVCYTESEKNRAHHALCDWQSANAQRWRLNGNGGGALWRLVLILAGMTGADLVAAAAACAAACSAGRCWWNVDSRDCAAFSAPIFSVFFHEYVWSVMREERAEG